MTDHRDLHRRLHEGQDALWGRLADRRAAFLRRLEEGIHPGYRFPWRVAEAPAVVPREVFDLDVAAMRRLLDPYLGGDFRDRYRDHVPERYRRPDDSGWFPRFVATDFQRAFDEERGLFTWGVPEIQSFPGNLLLKPEMLRRLLPDLDGWSEADLFPDPDIGSHTRYVELLREIVGEAVIVELDPAGQTTLVDMLLFAKHLGLPVVDLRDVETDPATGEASYRRAITFRGDAPRTEEPGHPRRIGRILCRALPDEIDEAVEAGRLDPERLRALFQGTLERGTVDWVVHPQDFFVLSKETLVGNPAHEPALHPVTADLADRLAEMGLSPRDGVVKPLHRAGGRGLMGLDGALDAATLRDLARDHPRAFVWQARYGADGFGDGERPLYHELRLMWAAETSEGRVGLRLLTGLTRWSRLGDPANARWQRTPLTGTQGLLVS